MGILNNNYNEWGAQGDRTPSYKWNGKDYVPIVKTAKFKDYGLNVAPNVGEMGYARIDVVITLKNIQDGINKDYPGKGYGFVITDGSRRYKPNKAGHNNLVGSDIKPTGGMKWVQLVDCVIKYGIGFDGNIHKNIDPFNQPKTKAGYGLISPKAADDPISSKLNNFHNNHLDLKYNAPYNPYKPLLMPKENSNSKSMLDYLFPPAYADELNDSGTLYPSKPVLIASLPQAYLYDAGSPFGNMQSTNENTFYNSAIGEVNYDPTQRVVTNGITPQSELLGNVSNPPVSSKPFNRKEPYSTPNSQSIKNTLYSSVKNAGAGYLKGYLVGRSMELILGKKLSKTVNKYSGYYANVSGMARNVAPAAWQAASSAIAKSAIGTAISNAWGTLAKTAIGQAVKGVVSSLVGSALGTVISAALPWIGVAMAVFSIFKLFFR